MGRMPGKGTCVSRPSPHVRNTETIRSTDKRAEWTPYPRSGPGDSSDRASRWPEPAGEPGTFLAARLLHGHGLEEAPHVSTLLRRASDGVLQRFDGPLHFSQEDPQLLAKPLHLRRGDCPLPGRPDEPFLRQDAQRVPDVMLRISRQLREPDDADRLAFLHHLQQGNVAAEQIQVLAHPIGRRAPSDRRLAAAAHQAQEKDPPVNVDPNPNEKEPIRGDVKSLPG